MVQANATIRSIHYVPAINGCNKTIAIILIPLANAYREVQIFQGVTAVWLCE